MNNKQRRAAKQRKRAKRQSGRPGGASTGAGAGSAYDTVSAYALAQSHVSDLVQAWLGQDIDDVDLLLRTGAIAKAIVPAPEHVVADVVHGSLIDVVDAVVKGGWSLAELEQVVRRTHESWLPVLGTAVEGHLRRVGGDDESASFLRMAGYDQAELRSVVVAAEGIGLLTLLCDLPLLDAEAVARSRKGRDEQPHPKWQQVRALLAKAESTDFGPEAEALVAKAQELITKHALGRLVAADSSSRKPAELDTRRLWLDRPYLAAKAALVGVVARANRCRSAFAERYGFSIVMGDEADLDAVELLVTSLLLQADTAMFVHGRTNASSRKKSFRQSFLMAYATRIGERLREADENAVAGVQGALPVLRDHESRVAEAFAAMVPTERARSVRVTDPAGWVAGTTAADLASLEVRDRLTE